MKKLLKGLHHFQTKVFDSERELFERLAKGQKPQTLFITCSDSRLLPNRITQSGPGDLFIMRNAGNIVPPYQEGTGEAATIEFATRVLKVKDIVVCGHSHCGAMQAMVDPSQVETMPAIRSWLDFAAPMRKLLKENYGPLAGEDLLSIATQENVLFQLENIRSHPSVAESLAAGKLRLHAWVYKFESGEVFGFSPEQEQFLPINQEDYKPIFS